MSRLAPALLLAALAAARASAQGLDAPLYAELLLRHTREVADTAGVRVDYAALRGDPAWRRLVAGLEAAAPEALADRRDRLAFWINAYNALAIDLVVRHPGVGSIREIGSFFRPIWKLEAGRVGGLARSLGEIEHEILRPIGEPRMHAAIVCASVSCPPLRREPYEPSRLDAQLDEQMRRFLASPEKGLRVDAATGTVLLSRVFDWFAADFEASGGALAFAARYAPAAARAFLEAQRDRPRVAYLPYDWSLNALEGHGP